MSRFVAFLVFLSAICSSFTLSAQAQTTGKTMRIVVPFPPAGSPDMLARVIAQNLSTTTGMQVTVENRPGAGGMVAAASVKNAAPDGYTLFLGSSSIYGSSSTSSNGPTTKQNASVDPLNDFAPVGLAAMSTLVLVTNPDTASNLKDFIAYVKAHPNLSYGSSGVGSVHHLAMEMLKSMTGMELQHIPYKGSAQTVPAVLSRDVVATFTGLNQAQPFVKAGRLNVLGIVSPTRTVLAPDVPTMAEAGVPGFGMTMSLGFFAPVKTPSDVVSRLNAEIVKAVQVAGTREKLIALGLEPATTSSPKEFAAIVSKELQQFGKMIKAVGMKAE
jgi:tripartite-type tricarboxylate transporter receptor subunit TctC